MLTENQIQHLRDKFAAYTGGPSSSRENLKSIALVGGVPTDYFESGLWEPDEALLGKTLQTLQRLGYTVASDFDPTIVNINEEYGGLDYMATDNPERFDVSIFCYILRIRRDRDGTKNDNNAYIKNSPKETRNRHSWLNAAIMHESKVLITHGRPHVEVSHKDFKGGWFFNKSPYQKTHSEPMPFHGPLNALQGSELHVMAHQDRQTKTRHNSGFSMG